MLVLHGTSLAMTRTGGRRSTRRDRATSTRTGVLRPAPALDARSTARRLAPRRRRSAHTRRLRRRAHWPTSGAASRPRSRRSLLDVGPRRTARRPRARAGPHGPSQGHAHRGLAARRAADARAGVTRRRRSACRCSSTSGTTGPARQLRRITAPRRLVIVNVPSWRGQARPRVLAPSASASPGRGDGRPQALLRPARPLAAAGRAGIRAAATSAAAATRSA